MWRSFSVMLLLAGLLVGSVLAADPKEQQSPQNDNDYESYKLLVDTIDQVERNYVKEVDHRELIEAAIRGMMAKLDPYSSYISPQEIEGFRSAVDSEFGGIGIQITIDEGELKILSPIYGTPAYKAGLMAGDRIVEIDGKSADDLSLEEAVERLKGQQGTSLSLKVIHPGSENKEDITVMREWIHVETALGYRRNNQGKWDFLFDPDLRIGYIRLTAFSRDTSGELRRALEELKAEKMRGLILDLRFNPGGLLNAAIEVSDLFISEGRIVSTKGRSTAERSWDAHKPDTFAGFPLVVLVNRYSASASEIVAACLQDHKQAIVMGERTWGKGSVQSVIELEDGKSALKLTTASYYRPSGKNIHRFPDAKEQDEWGVMPEQGFQLKLSDKEMVALIQDRRGRDILRTSPEGKSSPDNHNNTKSQKEFIDRQLQMAVKYLTTALAKTKE